VALDAFHVVVATGTLTLDRGQVTQAATVGTNAQALGLSLTNGQIFAGTGATLDGTTIDTSAATGLLGSVDSLKLVTIQQGAQSWLGVDASGIHVSLEGVEGVTLGVTGTVKLNRATNAAKLDWTTFTPSGTALPHLDVAATVDLAVTGTV